MIPARWNRFIFASRTSRRRKKFAIYSHEMNSEQTYRCWAEIDRSALRHNLGVVRERIGGAEILAVVKANAYGHGLVGVAEAVADEVQLFGVANLEEALALREAGLSHPVIILGPALPGERATIVEHGFIPTISTVEEAKAFARARAGLHQLQSRHRHGPHGCPRAAMARRLQGGVGVAKSAGAQRVDAHAGLERGCRLHPRPTGSFSQCRGAVSRGSSRRLQGARSAKRGHARFQRNAARNRSRRDHALRHLAVAGIPKNPAPGHDLEDPHRAHSRHAGRSRHQLRADFHHAARNAGGHACRPVTPTVIRGISRIATQRCWFAGSAARCSGASRWI